MLGGVSMFRAVDTSAMLSGNPGFQAGLRQPCRRRLHAAFLTMKLPDFTNPDVADCVSGEACSVGIKWLAMNCSPRLPSDGDGIRSSKTRPHLTQKFSSVRPNKEPDGTLAEGNEVRF